MAELKEETTPKREEFRDIETTNGEQTIKLRIIRPTVEDSRRADWEYSKVYNESMFNGIRTEAEMEKIMKERGIWTGDDEGAMNKIRSDIAEQVNMLINNPDLTNRQKVELKQIITVNRLSLLMKHNVLQSIKSHTCEVKADEARLIYLTQKCVRKHDAAKTPYWPSLDELRNESDQDFVRQVFNEVVSFFNAMPSDLTEMFPENHVEIDEEALAKEEEAFNKSLIEGVPESEQESPSETPTAAEEEHTDTGEHKGKKRGPKPKEAASEQPPSDQPELPLE